MVPIFWNTSGDDSFTGLSPLFLFTKVPPVTFVAAGITMCSQPLERFRYHYLRAHLSWERPIPIVAFFRIPGRFEGGGSAGATVHRQNGKRQIKEWKGIQDIAGLSQGNHYSDTDIKRYKNNKKIGPLIGVVRLFGLLFSDAGPAVSVRHVSYYVLFIIIRIFKVFFNLLLWILAIWHLYLSITYC